MTTELLPLRAASYHVHPLHATDRVWTETNCYVDVWIEVLHSLGLNPMIAAPFTLSADFEGDQWTFFKYPEADLRAAYGIDVHEMNPWRGVIEHVTEQLALGRLMTVEADSWFLPDTAGVSYRIGHTKSTIVPNRVDLEERRLGYFHNAGYFELSGDDFDGVFRLGAHASEAGLPPYTELVRLERLVHLDDEHATSIALELLADHSARRPSTNPVRLLGERVAHDLEWLRTQPAEMFHAWAFGTVRQCGACAEIASAFLRWLAPRIDDDTAAAASDHWLRLAEHAKALQFQLARAARGRAIELATTFDAMCEEWSRAQDLAAKVVDR